MRALVVISALALSACTSTEYVDRPVIVYPDPELLQCKDAPAKPAAAGRADFEWVAGLADAYADCKIKLNSVREHFSTSDISE